MFKIFSRKNVNSGPLRRYATGKDLGIDAQRRLDPGGPKRILTLDGGGIRGAISLGILKHIEENLRQQWQGRGHVADDFRLWHYFDFIVGTSTGAIIATLLASGLRVSEIEELYKRFAKDVFETRGSLKLIPERLRIATGRGQFGRTRLMQVLDEEFHKIEGWPQGNCLLKDAPLKTGLGIVVRCLDEDHTWMVHNNRSAKYFDVNAGTPLLQFVRSSTAAPPYFRPERMEFMTRKGKRKHVVGDGGLSAFNNPSLGSLLICTLKKASLSAQSHRGFRWELGHNKILLVSVGTGWLRKTRELQKLLNVEPELNRIRRIMRRPYRAFKWRPMLFDLHDPILHAFMGDSNFLSQAVLTWMSNTKTRYLIHGAAETLSGEFLHPTAAQEQFLTYLRYDAMLHEPKSYPPDNSGAPLSKTQAEERGNKLYEFTNGRNVTELLSVGNHVGQQNVRPEHFPSQFVPTFW